MRRDDDADCLQQAGITRAALYDSFISKSEDLPELEEFLIRLAEKHGRVRFGRVLDVGCGTGRVLPVLARVSERVTAIDMNREYVDRARMYLDEVGLSAVDLYHSSLTQFEGRAVFDLVSMINGVFYYFESGPALEQAFAQVYEALQPDGMCVAEGGNLLYFLRHYGDGFSAETVREIQGQQVSRRIRHSLDLTDARWTHHDTYHIEGSSGQAFREKHSFTIFTPLAVRETLERVGFVDVSVYEGWNMQRENEPNARRVVFVARKAR